MDFATAAADSQLAVQVFCDYLLRCLAKEDDSPR